jgi:HEPN domain-containing protein
LLSAADKAERIVEMLQEECAWKDYGIAAKELWQRLEDEVSHQLILQVELGKIEFYEDPAPFGQEVCEAFPSAIVDLQEACTCYALGRNVACVMHLQRALEFTLKLLCAKIGATEFLPSWHAMLKKMDNELKKSRDEMHEFVREHLQQTAEAAALLREVQFAWRNPSMHVDAIYDESKTLEVLTATRAFMRSLSGLISERQNDAST